MKTLMEKETALGRFIICLFVSLFILIPILLTFGEHEEHIPVAKYAHREEHIKLLREIRDLLIEQKAGK